MNVKVFISYSHVDKDIAYQLQYFLEGHKIKVIIDKNSLDPGKDITKFIEKAISETDFTIAIISKKSLSSSWVAIETINTFFHEKMLDKTKFIACSLDSDLFKVDYTDNLAKMIEPIIKKIEESIKLRMESNRQARDLSKELERRKLLYENLDKIVERLRDSASIEIGKDNLTEPFNRILETIAGKRRSVNSFRKLLLLSILLIVCIGIVSPFIYYCFLCNPVKLIQVQCHDRKWCPSPYKSISVLVDSIYPSTAQFDARVYFNNSNNDWKDIGRWKKGETFSIPIEKGELYVTPTKVDMDRRSITFILNQNRGDLK